MSSTDGIPDRLPVLRRAPLSREHRKAAMLAGAVGNGLVALGLQLVGGVVVALILLGVHLLIAALPHADEIEDITDRRLVAEELAGTLGSPIGIAALVAVTVLGVAVFVVGIVLSARIMRRRGVRRPSGVTWSALGIGRAVVLLLTGSLLDAGAGALGVLPVLAASAQVTGEFDASPSAVTGMGAVIAVGTVLVSVAMQAGIGLLAWWWMAHAFRGDGRELVEHSTQQTAAAPIRAGGSRR